MQHLARGTAFVAWLVWAAPTIRWAARGWAATEDGMLQLAVLALGLGALATELARGLDAPAGRAPLALVAVGPIAAAFGPDLSTSRAVAVVLSGYGLLGLVCSRERWRSLGALVPLAVLALPVLPLADAFVGWPIRRATAALVATLVGGVSSETVIAVEGAVTHIDAPCAGLRTWWVGAAGLLLAAAHQRAGFGPRVAAALALQGAVGFAANVARVLAVVGLARGLGWTRVAESVHLPLGLIGAAASFAVGWWVLPSGAPAPRAPAASLGGALWAAALASALAAAAPRPTHRFEPEPAPPLPALFTPVSATPAEQRFADRYGAVLVEGSTGPVAVALVTSRSWLAHHVPTMCLRAAGWTPTDERLVSIDGHTVRRVSLTRGDERGVALWWFASGDRATDDVVERIRDGLLTGRPWTLVSVWAVDGADPAPAVRALWDSMAGREG